MLPKIVFLDEYEKRKLSMCDLQLIMDGSPVPINIKHSKSFCWQHKGIVIFLSNYTPDGKLGPFLNRLAVVNADQYKADELEEVYLLSNGRIFSKDRVDLTIYYMDFIQRLTNGHPELIVLGNEYYDADEYDNKLSYCLPDIAIGTHSAFVKQDMPTWACELDT